jgi:hypothetical protein
MYFGGVVTSGFVPPAGVGVDEPDRPAAEVSAGSHPKPLHTNAVRAIAEDGIDIADRRRIGFLLARIEARAGDRAT